jgi:hypothetical protein
MLKPLWEPSEEANQGFQHVQVHAGREPQPRNRFY